MKSIQLQTVGVRVTRIAAVPLAMFLALPVPAVSQILVLNALPAGAVAFASTQPPKGVTVLSRVPLYGQPVTRMYTQWESGRAFLYIEHGREQLTAVDVTRKRNPQLVNHPPAQVQPARYEELADGGTIEASQPAQVVAGFDNLGGRGMFSILEPTSPDDAALLRAFGRESSNLPDRDRNLIFFASPAELLIVEDHRWKGTDYTMN